MKLQTQSRYPSWYSMLSAVLASALVFLGPAASVARAGSLGTEAILAQAGYAQADRSRAHLHRVLERPEVVRELARLGVDPSEAHRRIQALSDAEVSALQGRLDQIPAGGSAVGVIVGAILIVFFVLLFTDLVGATDVFPWVNKH